MSVGSATGPYRIVGVVVIVLGAVVLVALVRGHRGWARTARRTAAGVVVVLSVGGALVACQSTGTASGGPASSPQATAPTTVAPAQAPPASVTPAAPPPGAAAAAVWDALAQCEAGGDWAIDTGNGLYGGMQLGADTWLQNGGGVFAPLPNGATREQQIVVAERVRATQGVAPWGSGAAKLGLQ